MNLDYVAQYSTEELQRIFLESTYRQKGRTTRLVDRYIQELFNHNNEWITITDHTDLPSENECKLRMAKHLFDRILKRLRYEHNYGVDKSKLSIEHRVNDDCEFQVKLKYTQPNKDFIKTVFDELYKRFNQE